jgi:WXG100 family type VII secretion target
VTVSEMALMDAGAFLRQIATSVGGGFRQMDAEVDAMAAYWGGPAASSFGAGWQQASAGAVSLLSSLEGMAELLGVQSGEFASVDENLSADLTDTAPVCSSLNI